MDKRYFAEQVGMRRLLDFVLFAAIYLSYFYAIKAFALQG